MVRRLPSDIASSEVSGRSFAPGAPPPVENLVVRVLTESSIQLEWTSRNADGFIARILENTTVVQQKVISDFSNHSIHNVTNLKPETDYRIEVTAFYFPPSDHSISSVSSAQVRTLPAKLPTLQLTWKYESELKIYWKNPTSPVPTAHRLNCSVSSKILIAARLGGSTNFVALPESEAVPEKVDCVLESWFSVDQEVKVTTRFTALKATPMNDVSSHPDVLYCPRLGEVSISSGVGYAVEKINGVELLVFTFSKSNNDYVTLKEVSFLPIDNLATITACGTDKHIGER